MRWVVSLALIAATCAVASADSPPTRDGVDRPPSGVFALPAEALTADVPFSELEGAPALLVLFQPACGHCLVQLRRASAFAAEHPEVTVVAISLRGRAPDLVAELRRSKAQLPAYKASPALLEALGSPEGTPRVYSISSSGDLQAEARGVQDGAALAKLSGID